MPASVSSVLFYGKRTENLKSFTYFPFFKQIVKSNLTSRMSQANLDSNSSTNLQALSPFPQSQLPKSQIVSEKIVVSPENRTLFFSYTSHPHFCAVH